MVIFWVPILGGPTKDVTDEANFKCQDLTAILGGPIIWYLFLGVEFLEVQLYIFLGAPNEYLYYGVQLWSPFYNWE